MPRLLPAPAQQHCLEGGQGRRGFLLPPQLLRGGRSCCSSWRAKEQMQEGIPKALRAGGQPLQTAKVGGKIILFFLRSWESLGISSQPQTRGWRWLQSPRQLPQSTHCRKKHPQSPSGCQHRLQEPGRSQRGAQKEQSTNPLLPKAAKELTQSGILQSCWAEAAGEGWQGCA